MKKLIILPLLFIAVLLYPQSEPDTILTSRINKIENKQTIFDKQNTSAEIENLKDKLVFQQNMNEQTINSISSQLNAASYNLTLFGILFAIASIALGFHVARIERKIVKIGEENKELLSKNQKIKEDVDAVNKLIQSDIHKLYIQIKREETDYILNRLVKAPIEIKEVSYTLLSRELLPENFPKLRQAYQNLDKTDINAKMGFVKIFTLHFLGQTLKDEQLRKEFSGYIVHVFTGALENEIIKCTMDLSTLIVDEGIQAFQKEINFFFLGLTNSKYKKCQEVTQLLFDNLKTRKNRFDTFNIVESVQHKRFAKIKFGNILYESYFNDNPTESELLVFSELKELIYDQQKDDELTK